MTRWWWVTMSVITVVNVVCAVVLLTDHGVWRAVGLANASGAAALVMLMVTVAVKGRGHGA